MKRMREKKKGPFYLEEIKNKEWLLATVLACALIIVPGIVFALYAGLDSVTSVISPLTIAAIVLIVLIANYLKEKRVWKQSGLSPLQKGIRVAIVLVLLLNIFAIGLFLYSPPPSEKDRFIERISVDFANIKSIYLPKQKDSEAILLSTMKKGNFTAFREEVANYDNITSEMSIKIIALCEKSDEKKYSLDSIDELGVLCSNRGALIQCFKEEVENDIATVDFFENISQKIKEECHRLLYIDLPMSQECIAFQSKMNVTSTNDYSGLEYLCANLPD